MGMMETGTISADPVFTMADTMAAVLALAIRGHLLGPSGIAANRAIGGDFLGGLIKQKLLPVDFNQHRIESRICSTQSPFAIWRIASSSAIQVKTHCN
jgi:hypothetical protein